MCIEKNVFPSSLKIAKVLPISKANDTTNPNKLKHISILPLLSKPLERHIHKHILNYLNTNNLLYEYQSRFRPKHSCHTTLTRLTDKWLTSINESDIGGAIVLDFKKAFDLINHDILLKKLQILILTHWLIRL